MKTTYRDLVSERSQLETSVKQAAAPANRLSDEDLHELWNQHKGTPATDFAARNKIVQELWGYVPTAVRPYINSGAPISALEGKAEEALIKGIESWDPKHVSGAPLRSWTYRQIFPKGNSQTSVVSREVQQYADMIRIKSPVRFQNISKARALREEFKYEHNRYPTTQELQDLLGLSAYDTKQLELEMTPIHYTESMIDDDQTFGSTMDPNISFAIKSVYTDRKPDDKEFMRVLFWPILGGPKPLGMTQKDKAKQLGLTATQFTRKKQSIMPKIKAVAGSM